MRAKGCCSKREMVTNHLGMVNGERKKGERLKVRESWRGGREVEGSGGVEGGGERLKVREGWRLTLNPNKP